MKLEFERDFMCRGNLINWTAKLILKLELKGITVNYFFARNSCHKKEINLALRNGVVARFSPRVIERVSHSISFNSIK